MKKEQALSGSIRDVVINTASTFLQDFADAIAVGDRAKAAVAAAQVSQLGLSVFEFFGSGSEAIVQSHQERAACHEAAIVVRNMMEKNLEHWYQESKTVAEKAKLLIN